jgi:hypothetical protein
LLGFRNIGSDLVLRLSSASRNLRCCSTLARCHAGFATDALTSSPTLPQAAAPCVLKRVVTGLSESNCE